jgi:outer membrane protein OmpU
MRQTLLHTSMLAGLGSLAALVPGSQARAADGIKLEVGGYFSTAYVAAFDNKEEGRFGNHRTVDALKHDAEVHFTGETTLDNGVHIEARIELEGENDDDQIDKSWVAWSGGFGQVRVGVQDDALELQCPYVPGGTANFSAFSPTGWGANAPISSNSYCFSADNDSQKILYITPNYSGFQLTVSYTPNGNAQDYTQAGVNSAGTPTSPAGTAEHIVSAYATYLYEGEDWSLNWGGGGSWQTRFNQLDGDNDGKSAAYQTSGSLSFGSWEVGGVFQYLDQGGANNNLWVAGAGMAYWMDSLGLGLQYSHGQYYGEVFDDGLGGDGHRTLDRVVATATYNLAAGVDLDADIGYTWYRDTRDATPDTNDRYGAFEVGIGSSLAF